MGLYLRSIVLIGAVLAIAPATPVSAADAVAHVTTVIGDATANGSENLQRAGVLTEGGKLATGSDGKCSLLVDNDALLEVCENTELTLERDGRARIVRLNAGSIRIVAEPRQAQERIEIHTPAAIATLLGTIVHVEVDPVTGLTVVTSTHSKVKVQSADETPDSRLSSPGDDLAGSQGTCNAVDCQEMEMSPANQSLESFSNF